MSEDCDEVWARYYDADWHFDDEWLSVSIALERLERWEGTGRAQSVAAQYLRSGLWKARARKAVIKSGPLEYFEPVDFEERLTMLPGWGRNCVSLTLGAGMVQTGFWNRSHALAGEKWEIDPGFMWPGAARIQLHRGIVETFDGQIWEGLPDDHFLAFHVTLFGVEICPSDVDATAPSVSIDSKIETNTSSTPIQSAPIIGSDLVQRKGGRRGGNHGEAIAKVTLMMGRLSEVELKRWTAESLGIELAGEYKKLGEIPPSEDNCQRYAQGILRVLRN